MIKYANNKKTPKIFKKELFGVVLLDETVSSRKIISQIKR